jgi:hypothetical protein
MKVGDLVAAVHHGEIGIITEYIPHPITQVMSYRVGWVNPYPVGWSLEIESQLEVLSESR